MIFHFNTPTKPNILWQSNFGPKSLHFDDWQRLGEQICQIFFSSNMERFYDHFFILFLNVVMSNVYVFSSTFNCWNENVYQKEKTLEELCPHVHNSIKEILLMFCYCIGLSRLSCGSPWTFVMSLIYSWRPLWMYHYSGVWDLSQNVSSIIVPRCLSSDSLVLLENCLFKSCSEDGVEELIPVGSGIGRGLSSSPSSLSWLSDSSRCGGS